MAKIQVKVTNRFGVFEGFVNLAANTSEKEAYETLQSIRDSINTINMLSIENDDGSATIFPETILRHSVLNLKFQE